MAAFPSDAETTADGNAGKRMSHEAPGGHPACKPPPAGCCWKPRGFKRRFKSGKNSRDSHADRKKPAVVPESAGKNMRTRSNDSILRPMDAAWAKHRGI